MEASEKAKIISDISSAKKLLGDGKAQEALHVMDALLMMFGEHEEARHLWREIYRECHGSEIASRAIHFWAPCRSKRIEHETKHETGSDPKGGSRP